MKRHTKATITERNPLYSVLLFFHVHGAPVGAPPLRHFSTFSLGYLLHSMSKASPCCHHLTYLDLSATSICVTSSERSDDRRPSNVHCRLMPWQPRGRHCGRQELSMDAMAGYL